MRRKAEVMQCSYSTLMTDNAVECKIAQPFGLSLKIPHSALLTAHLEQLNLTLRALIEELSGSTGTNFKDKQVQIILLLMKVNYLGYIVDPINHI